MKKKLTKLQKNKMFAGVCGGIAEYFNIDATIVRLVFVLFTLLKGAGLILYIIAALVIPSPDFTEDDIDNMKSANCDESNVHSESTSSQNTSQNSSEEKKNSPHSDEEFDNYFKK